YRVRVKNESNKLQSGLTLLEDLEDPRPRFKAWHAAKLAEDRRVKSFRISGRRYRKTFRAARLGHSGMPDLGPGQELEVPFELTPLKRGTLRFKGVTMGRVDALGLFRAFIQVPAPQSVTI